MSKAPLVSIIIPVYNDAEYIPRSLESCTNQSLRNIEIICIDDVSTDNSVSIIKKIAKEDDRIRVIEQPKNMSALQARRVGIEAAKGTYILFLDGDDEIHKDTARLAYKKAVAKKADVVGFGVKIVLPNNKRLDDFENTLQPKHSELHGVDIVKNLFEVGKPAQGHIWRYLFSKELLVKSYEHISDDATIYRANDIMITFVAMIHASHYVSIPKKLYSYHFYNGGSGHENIDYDKFLFYSQAIDSIESVKLAIKKISKSPEEMNIIDRSYGSAYSYIIANLIGYIINNLESQYKEKAIRYLFDRVPEADIAMAISAFRPKALLDLQDYFSRGKNSTPGKNVLIVTNNLDTGGLQGVVVSQARYLSDSGYNVTILLRTQREIAYDVPEEIEIEKISGDTKYDKLRSLSDILQSRDINYVIDHSLLYHSDWPYYALISKVHGAKTFGWLHNFALRPAHDLSADAMMFNDYLGIIDTVVTLSHKDVSHWKMLGHKNTVYLPNPPSPMLLDNPPVTKAKTAPEKGINLIWYGRLQQNTKKLYSLVKVAERLARILPDFKLTIIGPDSTDLTAQDLKDRIKSANLQSNVHVVGEKRGEELIKEINQADMFVYTSDIEGYPLVITEAQAFALPVVIYELPWLAVAENNEGMIQIRQGDAPEMARQIYAIANDKERFTAMSQGSIDAAKKYLSYNFAELYNQLLQGTLPDEYSPEPNLTDAKMLLEWHGLYLEKNAKYVKQQIKDFHSSVSFRIGRKATAPARRLKPLIKKHILRR